MFLKRVNLITTKHFKYQLNCLLNFVQNILELDTLTESGAVFKVAQNTKTGHSFPAVSNNCNKHQSRFHIKL